MAPSVELMKAKLTMVSYRILSYLLEGLVIYVVLCVIPNYKQKVNTKQAIVMSLMIASSLAMLDAFTVIGSATR